MDRKIIVIITLGLIPLLFASHAFYELYQERTAEKRRLKKIEEEHRYYVTEQFFNKIKYIDFTYYSYGRKVALGAPVEVRDNKVFAKHNGNYWFVEKKNWVCAYANNYIPLVIEDFIDNKNKKFTCY